MMLPNTGINITHMQASFLNFHLLKVKINELISTLFDFVDIYFSGIVIARFVLSFALNTG